MMIVKKSWKDWVHKGAQIITKNKLEAFEFSDEKKRIAILAGIVALIGLSLGWVWQSQQSAKAVATEQTLIRAQKIEISATKDLSIYAGAVRGRYESQLAFRVGGKIAQRFVELGSIVKPGDALMQIDAKDIQQTVNIASAQMYSAQSQLKLATSNLDRYRQLYEQNAISKVQYEQYLNAYEVASANANQASAQYAQCANQLDYSVLRADKAGVVSAVSAESGQVVGAGQVVLTLVQDSEREVEINVPESRINSLRQVEEVTVKLWALPDVEIKGKVREIAPMADTVARTYRVRISLIQPPARMTLGMTASVETSGSDQKNTIIYEIPLSALYQTGQQPSVWVVQHDTVTLRPVQTGKFGKTTLQITSGLQAGDTIVTAGVHKLHEGQKVRLEDGALK